MVDAPHARPVAIRRLIALVAALATAALLIPALPAGAGQVAGEGPSGEPLGLPEACDDMPGGVFDDVDPAATHAEAVDCAAHLGLTVGMGEDRYEPDLTVPRGQMASFLARLVDAVDREPLVDPGDASFDDDDHPLAGTHADSVHRLADDGIVQGRADGTYGYGDPVDRAPMASFLVRAAEHAAGEELVAAPDDPFDDVQEGDAHHESILKAVELRMTEGVTETTYEPWSPLTRAQMAMFLLRTYSLLTAGAEGEVVSAESGEPLEGATVTVTVGGEPLREAVTDEDGAWSVWLRPGDYVLVADAEGHQPSDGESVEVGDGERVEVGFALEPIPDPEAVSFTVGGGQAPTDVPPGGRFDPTVAVQLLDAEDQPTPVAGVEVELTLLGDGVDMSVHLDGDPVAETGPDGVAVFDDLGVTAEASFGYEMVAEADGLDEDAALFDILAQMVSGSADDAVHALNGNGFPQWGWADDGVADLDAGTVWTVDVAPDRSAVFAGTWDGELHALEVADGDPVTGFGDDLDAGVVRDVLVAPDSGTVYAATGSGLVLALDATTGEPVDDFGDDGVYASEGLSQAWSLAVSPDGERLWVGGLDGDAGLGSEPAGSASGDGTPPSLEIPPSTIHAVDATSGELDEGWADDGVYDGHGIGQVEAMVAAADGGTLFTAGFSEEIHALAQADGALIGDWADDGVHDGHTGSIWSLALSPDGAHLASGSADGTVHLLDAASGEVDGDWADDGAYTGQDGGVRAVGFSLDGQRLFNGSVSEATIHAVDVASGELDEEWADDGLYDGHDDNVLDLAITP